MNEGGKEKGRERKLRGSKGGEEWTTSCEGREREREGREGNRRVGVWCDEVRVKCIG